MPSFIVPYNFARTTPRPMPKLAPRDWMTSGGNSGVLHLSVTAESPLFVPESKSYPKNEISDKHFFREDVGFDSLFLIPGTSLKGAFRTLAEAISGSCSPFGGGRIDGQIGRQCQSNDLLCPCCRLFGYLKPRSKDVMRGRVCISDARMLIVRGQATSVPQQVILGYLGGPKPEHTAFYQDGGHDRGRKFYWHHPGVKKPDELPTRLVDNHIDPRIMGAIIRPLPAGGEFSFTVSYQDLSDTELGLLLWTLLPSVNETTLRSQKVGFGKAAGLGSVRVRATKWDARNAAARFTSFDAPPTVEPLETCLAAAKTAFTRERAQALGVPLPADGDLFTLPDPPLEDLRVLLNPDALPLGVPIKHPSNSWFDRNGQTRLPDAVQTHAKTYLVE